MPNRRAVRCLLLVVSLVAFSPALALAQVFGTFSWQMQPYCNIVTLTLSQTPAGFALFGADDQCGAAVKGSAVGVAVFNPNGTVGVNFTIVTSPGGKGLQVAATVSPSTGQGTWVDSVGNSGVFAFFGNAAGLPARPLPPSGIGAAVITTVELAPGAVGGTDINTAEVQSRVTGTCPVGQYMRGINSDGTVLCQALTSAADHAGALKAVSFLFANVPAAGTTSQLASLTFTAPITGIAVLESRGYCTIDETVAAVEIDIAAGPDAASAFNSVLNSVSHWGVISIPPGTTFYHQLGWTTRNELAVTAGASITQGLFGRHSSGSAPDDCSGTLTVTFHSAALP